MQHEAAQVLEPLYRLGEEWDKLVEVYKLELERLKEPDERQNLLRRLAEIAENRLFDQVQAFEWWSQAVLEDPKSEQAQDELLRLVRVTHQWEHYVGTMLQAAQQAPEVTLRRDVLMRLAAVFETDLVDLARAEEVLHQVLAEQPEDADGTGVPGPHLRSPGHLRPAGRGAASADRHHRRFARAGVTASAPWPGAGRRAGEPDRGHRQLPGGAGAGQPQQRGPGGARAAVLPERALGGAVRGLRAAAGHRPGRRGHGRLLRPHGPHRQRGVRGSGKGGRAVAQGPGPARGRPGGAGGAGRPARAGRGVARADRGSGQPDPRRGLADGSHPAVQAAGAHLG